MGKLPEEIRNSLNILQKIGNLDELVDYVDKCYRYFYKVGFSQGKLSLIEKIQKNLKANIKKELSHYLGDWKVLDGMRMKRVRNQARENLVEAFILKLLRKNL